MPLHVAAGDIVTVRVTEGVDGKVVKQIKTPIERAMKIDTLLIVDYEQRELDELGLSDALGGIFGTAT